MSPRRRPVVRAAWPERLVTWVAPHQLSVRVPVIGWPIAPDFGYRVGTELQGRWRSRPLDGARVLSVAGHCGGRTARRTLTLLITLAEPRGAGRRLDGIRMARDVTAAVASASRSTAARI